MIQQDIWNFLECWTLSRTALSLWQLKCCNDSFYKQCAENIFASAAASRLAFLNTLLPTKLRKSKNVGGLLHAQYFNSLQRHQNGDHLGTNIKEKYFQLLESNLLQNLMGLMSHKAQLHIITDGLLLPEECDWEVGGEDLLEQETARILPHIHPPRHICTVSAGTLRTYIQISYIHPPL